MRHLKPGNESSFKKLLNSLANIKIGNGSSFLSGFKSLTSLKIGRSGDGRQLLSISIEHGFVKLLVTRGLEVVDFKILMASPEFFREGLVGDKNRVSGIIQGALDEMSLGDCRVIGAVPGFQNTLRIIRLPNVKGLQPSEVIPREARRTMGVSLETNQLAWRELGGEMERKRWVVVSAARHSVSSLVDTAQQAGLKVSIVDLRAFALARVANQPDAVFAWLAPDGCDVIIIKESVPVQQQSLFWGAGQVEGAVLVERVSDMVERTISLYNDANADAAIMNNVPLYVSGSPISVETDIGARVATNLQRPAATLAPPLPLPPDFPLHDMVVNIGLALRGA